MSLMTRRIDKPRWEWIALKLEAIANSLEAIARLEAMASTRRNRSSDAGVVTLDFLRQRLTSLCGGEVGKC